MKIKYCVPLPGVPGPDLLYPSHEAAQREAANARSQGLEVGDIVEVLVG